MTTSGHRANEHAVVTGVAHHAYPIAEDRSARKRARWVDGDYTDLATLFPEGGDEPVDQTRFAGARRTGQADDVGATCRREHFAQHVDCARLVFLDETDRARQGADIAGLDSFEAFHRSPAADQRLRRISRAMTTRWISLVPSPMVHSFMSR